MVVGQDSLASRYAAIADAHSLERAGETILAPLADFAMTLNVADDDLGISAKNILDRETIWDQTAIELKTNLALSRMAAASLPASGSVAA